MNENDDEFPFSFSVICHLYGEKIKIIVIVVVIVRIDKIMRTGLASLEMSLKSIYALCICL